MISEMTPYDRKAWAEIERWREKRLTGRARRLLPQKVLEKASDAGRAGKARFDSLPGASEFEALFAKAMGGLVELASRARDGNRT